MEESNIDKNSKIIGNAIVELDEASDNEALFWNVYDKTTGEKVGAVMFFNDRYSAAERIDPVPLPPDVVKATDGKLTHTDLRELGTFTKFEEAVNALMAYVDRRSDE
ncbi:MAG: hypothetical protein AAF485_22985 [Chloroflexota bacterium]